MGGGGGGGRGEGGNPEHSRKNTYSDKADVIAIMSFPHTLLPVLWRNRRSPKWRRTLALLTSRTTCTDRALLAFHAIATVSSGCSRASGDTVISGNPRGTLQTLSIGPTLIFQYFDLFPTRIA